jgi:small subunit ribosomal protein S1
MADVEKEEDVSFAELFEQSSQTPGARFSPGDRVTGTIVKISKETVFVDLGGKSEGTADLAEFLDDEGNPTVREGEGIELRVSSVRRGIHLSRAIKARGAEALEVLKDAHRNQIPVEGRVAAVNKGGFEVELSGLRAFCPISQIDLLYCEKPEEHVGQRYQFRITEMKERGRNIILSRRVLLQEEQEKKLKETLATLRPEMDVEGKVTRVMDFGAFVDIGGLEGMVHVSEIARARIGHPGEVLQPGQIVKARILRMETNRKGAPKVSLSMRVLEPEIWDTGLPFREGEVIPGKVSRLAEFGAFVEVAPGVDGLVHVSEISYQKVAHPNRVLKEGERVEVLVLKIDEGKRRLSLSIKEAQSRQRAEAYARESGEVRLEVGQVLPGIVEDHKPYGLFVRLPQFGIGVRGLLPVEELMEEDKADLKKKFPQGQEIRVEIIGIDDKERIRLSMRAGKDREERADFDKYMARGEKAGKMGTLGELLQSKLKR